MANDIKRTCELCGGTNRLQIDHNNETYDDNWPGNLRVLCKHCHMEKLVWGMASSNIYWIWRELTPN